MQDNREMVQGQQFYLTEENYEENKYLKLILDNEIRSYVVTNVFTINIDDEYES